MTVTGAMIITRGGTVLPLDQRIADALMNYAIQAADAEGIPRQTWCRKRWGLKDYEAKDVLKGNASKAIYERVLKLSGPHCGWHVGIAVTGAVVGVELHDFFREQMRQAAREAERAQEHERLAQTAYRRLAGNTSDPGQDRGAGTPPGALGAEKARRVARMT